MPTPCLPQLDPQSMNRRREISQSLPREGHELSIIYEIAHTLNASVDLDTLLQRALEKVAELLNLDTGWVLLMDEETCEPYLAAALNLPHGLRQEPERMTGGCYCIDSICADDISDAFNVGVVTCSRLQELALVKGDTAGLRYHASVPLRVFTGSAASGDTGTEDNGPKDLDGFKRLGILNVVSPGWRKLSQKELDFLYTVGDVLSVAIERARLHARRLGAAQAEERNRLAREIHDTIAQDLAAITYKLETIDVHLEQETDPVAIREQISSALGLVRKALEEARRSVLDLRAAPLEGRTLAEALAELAQATHNPPQRTATFELLTPIGALPPAMETGLYRLAQEAVKNARRHAFASHIHIRLDASPSYIHLYIRDNGKGFQVDSIPEHATEGRYGLLGMRERVKLLGGDFQIHSKPDHGTEILARVPRNPPNAATVRPNAA
jgi:two-component system, NarL family, sensor kinase